MKRKKITLNKNLNKGTYKMYQQMKKIEQNLKINYYLMIEFHKFLSEDLMFPR